MGNFHLKKSVFKLVCQDKYNVILIQNNLHNIADLLQ